MIKANEAIFCQADINCKDVIKNINDIYGPFPKEEIEFYREKLKNESGNVINSFQKQLIFNMFYKWFGDTETIYGLDSASDYIILMLAAKKILLSNHMIIMPYIISGKVDKLVTRKTINKKEETKLKMSSYYPEIIKKYRNERIINQILSNIATVISSNFRVIDYENPSIDGLQIEPVPDIVMEEMLGITLMI